jgi:hypothetical protein
LRSRCSSLAGHLAIVYLIVVPSLEAAGERPRVEARAAAPDRQGVARDRFLWPDLLGPPPGKRNGRVVVYDTVGLARSSLPATPQELRSTDVQRDPVRSLQPSATGHLGRRRTVTNASPGGDSVPGSNAVLLVSATPAGRSPRSA